jgi:hypothetical protein
MSEITAARINNLQNRIALIFGNGAGQNGYGQVLTSNAVDPQDGIIRADDLNSIYTDILKARIHQVGPGDLSVDEVIVNLNVVAEETSSFINDDGTSTNDPDGFKKGIADFERIIEDVESDKFKVHTSQAEQKLVINDKRSTSWNGLIYHEFTVTFDSADHRRHYFNSGGQIRFSAANTNARSQKGLDWASLFQEMGTIVFDYTETKVGAATQTNIGNYDLTSSYQTIYQKVGSGYYTGVYAGNTYTIKAREQSSSVIEFRVEFNDSVFDNNVDNNVDGRLESNIQSYIAKGAYVNIDDPSFYTTNSVSGFATPPDPARDPEYTIGVDLAQDMYEIANTGAGRYASVDYIVNAVNVDYPITLYWDTQVVGGSVTASDFTDNTLSGSLTITSSYTQAERTINRTIKADNFTEGSESFRLRLYTDSARNNFVDSTGVITIIDNSVGAIPAPSPTYAISSSTSTVSEGQSVTYTVQTSEVPDGTTLFYTIYAGTGSITASDFTDGAMSGSFTINSGTGSFTKTLRADSATEGTESYDIQLRTGSTSGSIVLNISNGAATFVADTSVAPPPVQYLSNSGTTITSATPGLYQWIAPANVTSVSVTAIGAGAGGYGNGGPGGGGGGLGWKRSVSVVPGQSYSVGIGAGGSPYRDGGDTFFRSLNIVSGRGGNRGTVNFDNTQISSGGTGGGYVGDGGGNGGSGGAGYYTYGGGGGGGAGGYLGNGGSGGKGGRSVSGISATNGTSGAGGAGGGGGGSGSTSPSLEAGGGGGVLIYDISDTSGTNSGSFGTAGNPATGGGGGTGAAAASSENGGSYGGGGGADGGSGSSSGGSGANGGIIITWADTTPEPEPEPVTPTLSVSPTTINFSSEVGVRPEKQRITFISGSTTVEVQDVQVSQPSSSATSIDYTGATGSPSGGTGPTGRGFTIPANSSRYLDVTYHRGVDGTGTSTLSIKSTAGTKTVVLNWSAENTQIEVVSFTVDSGKAGYPTVGDETTYNVFTYTVVTRNVPDGTVLTWNNVNAYVSTPINSSDVDGLTGTVIINNNTGTFTRTAIADETTEGTERFGTALYDSNGRLLRSAIHASIQDTSTTPAPPPPAPVYNPQITLPAEVEVYEEFPYSFTGGAPSSTWNATTGAFNPVGGTFDVNGNWSGIGTIPIPGSFTYTITYSDPTSETDYAGIIVNAPEININTPATISPTSATKSNYEGEILSTSFQVSNPTNETLNISLEVIDRPALGSVATSPNAFTLAPGGVRIVGIAGRVVAGQDLTRYHIGALASGYPGTYPTFTFALKNLGAAPAPPPPAPTYKLDKSTYITEEGAGATFTLTTTDVPDGTTVYWFTNADDSDVMFARKSGSGNVINNSATFTVDFRDDGVTEGTENFNLLIKSANNVSSTTLASATIVVSDKAPAPPPPPPPPAPTGSVSLSPSTAVINQDPVTLSWTTSNADSVEVRIRVPNGASDPVSRDATGSITAPLDAEGTWTALLYVNGDVIDTDSVNCVSPTPPPPPPPPAPTGTITTSRYFAVLNQDVVTISWTTSNADSVAVRLTAPGGTLGVLSTDASGSSSAALDQLGDWSATLEVNGSPIDSVTVTCVAQDGEYA